MARYQAKRLERNDNYFANNNGIYDLSGIKVLHTGVDTLRYIYTGKIKPKSFQLIKDLYETTYGAIFEYAGVIWKLGSGGRSGYRYRLQNNDLGVIVFYGSNHIKIDLDDNLNPKSHHVKVELSPHFIIPRSAKEVDDYVHELVTHLLDEIERPKIAVHLCVDVQGWEIPQDFTSRFRCKAHRIENHKGVSEYEFDLPATSVTHGLHETVTYGLPTSMQFQAYNKSKANQKQDKNEFWEKQWNKQRDENMNPLYDPEKPVYRIEYRFHHSVVEQFSRFISKGTDSDGNECILGNKKIRSFVELETHLNGFWEYACMSMRLDLSTVYIDPFWQFLLDDIRFHPQDTELFYKREYKQPGTGSERNTVMAMANKITVLVRKGWKRKDVFKSLKKDDIWPDIYAYYLSRGFNTEAIRDHVYKLVDNRILDGKAV